MNKQLLQKYSKIYVWKKKPQEDEFRIITFKQSRIKVNKSNKRIQWLDILIDYYIDNDIYNLLPFNWTGYQN
ncbi:unnamed protein product [Paramecium sonneborni]|uniref:Uncharacterized protein n=1 Tax=Paramecium sonneborni TaxID=65129 RepID=A0A8S1NDC9_9CILI|nr:unnamed protein product [Paramecium sonneborni]